MNLRHLAGRLVIQLLGVALLMEFVLRLTVPSLPGNYRTGLLWDRHPTFGWYHIPGSAAWLKTPEFTAYSKINSLGLRDVERGYAKERGVYRILVLGDSFPEAIQVPLEQSFPRVLEQRLAVQAGGRRVEVINGGVIAYSTDQQLLFFEQEGLNYQPDLVVLLFLDSDVAGNSRRLNRDSTLAARKPYFALDGPSDLKLIGLAPRPAVLNAAETAVRTVLGRSVFTVVFKTGVIDPLVSGLGSLFGTPSRELPRDLYVYSRTATPEWYEAWLITELLIERLRVSAQARGADFLLVMAAEPHQVYEESWQKLTAPFALPPPEWDLEFSNRRVREIADRRGWRLLDLSPAFRQAATAPPPLHFARDGHWTAEGHRLAATEIARYVVQQNVLRPAESR